MEGNYSPQSANFWFMVLWMAILLYGVAQTLSVYFPHAFGGLMNNIVINAMWSGFMRALLASRDAYENRTKHPQETLIDKCLTDLAKAVATCIFVITESLYSQAFGLQLRWMIMLNSINYIFTLRNTASHNGRRGDEDEWGFSQAVPMFLLILPIATVVETAWGTLSMISIEVNND